MQIKRLKNNSLRIRIYPSCNIQIYSIFLNFKALVLLANSFRESNVSIRLTPS